MNKRILLLSAFLLLFGIYINHFQVHKEVSPSSPLSEFPLYWKGWSGKDNFFNARILEKLKVSDYIMRDYTKGRERFSIYIGYYSKQTEDSQIHSPRHCLPGSGWFRVSQRERHILVDGEEVDFVEAVYAKGDYREMFIYWYRMKDRYITNEYLLKFYMILNSLKYRRNDAAFVRISAPVDGGISQTRKMLEQVIREFYPLLKRFTPS